MFKLEDLKNSPPLPFPGSNLAGLYPAVYRCPWVTFYWERYYVLSWAYLIEISCYVSDPGTLSV